MKHVRIIRVIDNVNMGLGHDGIARLCLEQFKFDVTKLGEDMLVMCLNRAKDKLKIIGCQGKVVGYLKNPKGRKIMMEAIQFIPTTFGANGFNYDDALKKALSERLVRTASQQRVGPLQAYRAMERAGLTART